MSSSTEYVKSVPFGERASIRLVLRHLQQFHEVETGELDDLGWEELARKHLSLHRSAQSSTCRHCYWTPAFARPAWGCILGYALTTLNPIGIFLDVPPIGLVAAFFGWLMTESFMGGVLWASGSTVAVVLILMGYSLFESFKLMFIPPDPDTLANWGKFTGARFADPALDGPFTSLWPASLKVWLQDEKRWKQVREDWGWSWARQSRRQNFFVDYECHPPRLPDAR